MLSKTIALSQPINVHGDPVHELTVRVGAKQMRHMPLQTPKVMGDLYELAAACCDIPPSAFEQLSPPDLLLVVKEVSDFLEGTISGTTPETPSP